MSTGLNVLRYSALGFGVFYGLTHQISLNSSARVAREKHDYEHKAQQIEKAKAEFLKRSQPPKTDDVVSDPDHPNFDLEKWINKAAAES